MNDLWHRRRERAARFVTQKIKPGHAWAAQAYAYDYETEHDMFLGWFDDNAKKTTAEKVNEAIAAYVVRFGTRPNIVLVNEADRVVEVQGMKVRSESYIRRNNFWVGWEAYL